MKSKIMSKNAKSSLQSLIEKIDWLKIEPVRASWKLADDAIAVRFWADNKRNPANINKVTMRFGKEVVGKMNWETGDKIAVFNDPDHLLTFKLVKSDNGNGFVLSKESNTFTHSVSFKWNFEELQLEERKSAEVNYHIFKDNLIILKVGEEEEIA